MFGRVLVDFLAYEHGVDLDGKGHGNGFDRDCMIPLSYVQVEDDVQFEGLQTLSLFSKVRFRQAGYVAPSCVLLFPRALFPRMTKDPVSTVVCVAVVVYLRIRLC